MGHIRHHAIIVTGNLGVSYDKVDRLAMAHDKAREIFGPEFSDDRD